MFSVVCTNSKLGRFKLWRPHPDLGIARKAKTFAWQKQAQIHFAIGIFVMDQSHGISTGLHIGDLHIARTGRSNLYLARRFVLGAIGEKLGIAAQAD